MKLGGRTLTNKNLEYAVIPRSDGDIVFKFKPVLNFTEFDKLCKAPEPGFIMDKDGARPNLDSKKYKEETRDYVSKKSNWMFLESISATENLEWESVNLLDPETWSLYPKEIEDSGITGIEFNLLVEAFQKVNNLSEDHLKEARDRFLASIREPQLTT